MDKNKIQKYDSLKLYFNSGVIAHIYSQICYSYSDFYGLLLGKSKFVKNTKVVDSHSNLEQVILNILIDNVIFIYDKNYLFKEDKLEKLFDKINKKYPTSSIIGKLNIYFYVCFLQEHFPFRIFL
jgi:hypothetical protein